MNSSGTARRCWQAEIHVWEHEHARRSPNRLREYATENFGEPGAHRSGFGALLLPWGYTRWLKSRMFELVDKEVKLEVGRIQTENFEINLREVYHLQIEVDYNRDYWVEKQTCPFRYWEAADWRVYRLSGRGEGTRELWASSTEMRERGAIPIGFKGRSGKYQLEWSVPATSV